MIKTSFLILLLALASESVSAKGDSPFSVHGFIEGRYVSASRPKSVFDNGPGRLRYGRGEEGFRFGEAVLDVNYQATHELSFFASTRVASDAASEVDVLEAFIRYRPVSLSRWRWGFRAGAFFPEISFENQGVGWSNLFTHTNSGANTWYSEEYRPFGLEASIERRGRDIKFEAAAALYGGNDRSGTALSVRGFTFNDQRIGLFNSLPLSDAPGLRMGASNSPFVESDNRPGLYLHAGFKSDIYGDFTLHLSDNFGNTEVVGSEGRVWRIRFINANYRYKASDAITLIAQGLYGDSVTTNTGSNDDRYGSEYLNLSLLGAWNLGDFRLSARPEFFWQDTIEDTPIPIDMNVNEHGFALTANATYRFLKHHQISAEFVVTDSKRSRSAFGPLVPLNETQGMLTYRISF